MGHGTKIMTLKEYQLKKSAFYTTKMHRYKLDLNLCSTVTHTRLFYFCLAILDLDDATRMTLPDGSM